MRSLVSKKETTLEINITSFIDFLFCLVIFFLGATKFKQLQGAIQTYLPKNQGIRSTPILQPIVPSELNLYFHFDPATNASMIRYQSPMNEPLVTCSSRQSMTGGRELNCAGMETLVEKIRSELQSDGSGQMVVKFRPEASVPWEVVVAVLDRFYQYPRIRDKIQLATSGQ